MPGPDEEECLLQWVYRRALTTAETDGRWLWRINTKHLWLGIEQSEQEAAAEAEAAKVTKLKRKQERNVRRLKGYIVISDSSDDDGSDSDVDPPPAADAPSSAGDPKDKGPARRW